MKHRGQAEETFNALSHLLLAAAAGLLLVFTPVKLSVFFLASFLTFSASAIYHAALGEMKAHYRKLDIASIFLLVPATVHDMLPLTASLAFIMTAGFLALLTLQENLPDTFTDVALITLAVAAGMLGYLFGSSSVALLLGLAFYGAGLPFYFLGDRQWMHAVWHVFVSVGWICHTWGKLW
jgi:hemolysin III